MLTDPEINAALAEKAMGWRIIERRGRVRLRSSQDIQEYYDDWTDNYVPTDGDEVVYSGPDFLTDPVASHALKEAMRAKGWRWYIQLREEGFLALFYRFEWTDDSTDEDEGRTEGTALAPSELRAVALAACRALGIEGAGV